MYLNIIGTRRRRAAAPPGGGGTSLTRIPFGTGNTDANNTAGVGAWARGTVPLLASDNITLADLPNIRICRASDNGEVSAYVGTLDTTDAEYGGGVIHHFGASRDPSTGMFTQAEASRPLLGLLIAVPTDGAVPGKGNTKNWYAELRSTPTQPRLSDPGAFNSDNAFHVTRSATDNRRLEAFKFLTWVTRWGKAPGNMNDVPFIDNEPTLFPGGFLPLPSAAAGQSRTDIDTIDATSANRTVSYFFYKDSSTPANNNWILSTSPTRAGGTALSFIGGNLELSSNDLNHMGGFQVTIQAGHVFTWGVTDFDQPWVTVTQLNYPTAPGSARVTETARTYDGFGSTDYDNTQHFPTSMLWCTDAMRLCKWGLTKGVLPKSVTQSWGGEYDDADTYGVTRWIAYNLARAHQGNPNTSFGRMLGAMQGTGPGANYESVRPIATQFFRTANPAFLGIAHNCLYCYDRLDGAGSIGTNNYNHQESRYQPGSLAFGYFITGNKQWAQFLARANSVRAAPLRDGLAGSIVNTSTRYYSRRGGGAAWAMTLRVWRPRSIYDGALYIASGGNETMWLRASAAIRASMGFNGVGNPDTHPGYLPDFGMDATRLGMKDDLNRDAATPDKALFSMGVFGGYNVVWNNFSSAYATDATAAAAMRTNSRADLVKLGQFLADINWLGDKPWASQALTAKGFRNQGAPYVSTRPGAPLGGRRWTVYDDANSSIYGPTHPSYISRLAANDFSATSGVQLYLYDHGWDTTANGGAGGWVVGTWDPTADNGVGQMVGNFIPPAGVTLTHRQWEADYNEASTEYNGMLFEGLAYLADEFATLPTYGSIWNTMYDIIMRRTTFQWDGTQWRLFATNMLNGELARMFYPGHNKALGETMMGWGCGQEQHAIRNGLPTS